MYLAAVKCVKGILIAPLVHQRRDRCRSTFHKKAICRAFELISIARLIGFIGLSPKLATRARALTWVKTLDYARVCDLMGRRATDDSPSSPVRYRHHHPGVTYRSVIKRRTLA